MCPKDHIVDYRFVDEVADLYKARYSGHHTEDAHDDLTLKRKREKCNIKYIDA